MNRRDLALHLVHVAAFAACFALAPSAPLLVMAAAGLFFACFLLAHDAMHGSLGLPRWANDALLVLFGVTIGVAGHAARAMHMHHHARPGAPDDLEGWGTRVPAWKAALGGFALYPAMAALSFGRVPRRQRGWLAFEWTAVLAAAVLAAGTHRGRAYVAVTVLLECTIALWGAHVPHRAGRRIRALAAALAWVRWPVLLGVATHDAHHRAPRVPTFTLSRAWRAGLARPDAPPATFVTRASARRATAAPTLGLAR